MRVVYKEIEFNDGTILEIKNRQAKDDDEWYESSGLYYDYAHIDETKIIDWIDLHHKSYLITKKFMVKESMH